MSERVQSLTVLLVSDLERSKAFYKEILGCEITDWWALRDDEIKLGFKLLQADNPASINPNRTGGQVVYDTYAYTDDFRSLDELFTTLKENGASIVKQPETTEFEWGTWKEFAIEDPDGYVIGFGTANK